MGSQIIKLGETLSYTARSAVYHSNDRSGIPFDDNRDFTLQIVCMAGKEFKVKTDETYAVEEQQQRPGVIGRVFLWVKSDGEIYETYLGRTSEFYCNCKSGQCRRGVACKHTDALNKLIELELIPNQGAKCQSN